MSSHSITKTGTILIVEDSLPSMMMAKELLELAGFKIFQAENADVGIRLAREQHPDLILMDMHLPIMDGYEASRILKSDPETSDIVIVAFTSLALDEEQEKALAHGCSGVICKPIDADHFAETIARFMVSKPQPVRPMALSPNARQRSNVDVKIISADEKGKSDSVERIRQLEEALAHNNVRFEQFLVRASHDLQAPLRKISQFSGLLQKVAADELSPDNQKILQGILRSTQQMQDILSDLFTLSRLHRNPVSRVSVSLSKVITEVIDEYREQIKSQGARIELGHLITLQTEPAQLKQLLKELVDNALKFTHENKPPVIRITSSLVDDKYYSITVEDNGIGFEAKYVEHIFLPMERLHGVSQYSGWGMGLAIAKKIVECQGGTIQVSSELDKGSTFTVLLPISSP